MVRGRGGRKREEEGGREGGRGERSNSSSGVWIIALTRNALTPILLAER
jgi:hypothetical protein